MPTEDNIIGTTDILLHPKWSCLIELYVTELKDFFVL